MEDFAPVGQRTINLGKQAKEEAYVWVDEDSTRRNTFQITHGPENKFLTRILRLYVVVMNGLERGLLLLLLLVLVTYSGLAGLLSIIRPSRARGSQLHRWK